MAAISGDPETKVPSGGPATKNAGWDSVTLWAASSAAVDGAGLGVALPEAPPTVPKGAR